MRRPALVIALVLVGLWSARACRGDGNGVELARPEGILPGGDARDAAQPGAPIEPEPRTLVESTPSVEPALAAESSAEIDEAEAKLLLHVVDRDGGQELADVRVRSQAVLSSFLASGPEAEQNDLLGDSPLWISKTLLQESYLPPYQLTVSAAGYAAGRLTLDPREARSAVIELDPDCRLRVVFEGERAVQHAYVRVSNGEEGRTLLESPYGGEPELAWDDVPSGPLVVRVLWRYAEWAPRELAKATLHATPGREALAILTLSSPAEPRWIDVRGELRVPAALAEPSVRLSARPLESEADPYGAHMAFTATLRLRDSAQPGVRSASFRLRLLEDVPFQFEAAGLQRWERTLSRAEAAEPLVLVVPDAASLRVRVQPADGPAGAHGILFWRPSGLPQPGRMAQALDEPGLFELVAPRGSIVLAYSDAERPLVGGTREVELSAAPSELTWTLAPRAGLRIELVHDGDAVRLPEGAEPLVRSVANGATLAFDDRGDLGANRLLVFDVEGEVEVALPRPHGYRQPPPCRVSLTSGTIRSCRLELQPRE